jgi:hypothetical protein
LVERSLTPFSDVLSGALVATAPVARDDPGLLAVLTCSAVPGGWVTRKLGGWVTVRIHGKV